MDDLELVAEGVLAAGLEHVVRHPDTRGEELRESLITIVAQRARVSVPVAHAALRRAVDRQAVA